MKIQGQMRRAGGIETYGLRASELERRCAHYGSASCHGNVNARAGVQVTAREEEARDVSIRVPVCCQTSDEPSLLPPKLF